MAACSEALQNLPIHCGFHVEIFILNLVICQETTKF